jgi:hypothetical protein
MKYLIYDTALNGLPTLMILQKYYAVNQSLFKGTKDEALIEASPWLFLVDSEQDENLSAETDLSMEFTLQVEFVGDIHTLSVHLKKFIYQMIDGREYFFRFYDARVLRRFLPTCDEDQLIEFFGPVKYFITEGDGPGEPIQFSLKDGTLIQRQLTMNAV